MSILRTILTILGLPRDSESVWMARQYKRIVSRGHRDYTWDMETAYKTHRYHPMVRCYKGWV